MGLLVNFAVSSALRPFDSNFEAGGYGVGRTRGLAACATDALRMICRLLGVNVHGTHLRTGITINAFCGINAVTENRNSIEQRVYCSERANIFAKRAVNHH